MFELLSTRMKDNHVFYYLLLTIFCCISVESKPRSDLKPFYSSVNFDIGKRKTKNIARYLSNYGYTTSYTENKKELRESIKDFQYFGGLLVTGELDSSTEELMQKDRCGLRDPPVRGKRLGRTGRMRRYNPQGTRWMKSVLTWRYVHNKNGHNAWRPNNPRGLAENDVRHVMKKAMSLWERRTNIKFVEDRTNAEPDIWIKFVRRRHDNDPFPFDGPGGTLAHAFYPLKNIGLAGDMHFDDDERFTIDNSEGNFGKDLMWVATHELGHTLGLDHSNVRDAIMFPFYMGYRRDNDLRSDDIRGIQSIYGKKNQKPKPKKQIPAHKICPTSKMTAVWDYGKDGNYMMVTHSGRLYTVSRRGKGIIHANIKSKDYYRIPYPIDAVYQSNLGKSSGTVYDIVFTSHGYYIYKGFSQISGPHGFRKRTYKSNSPLKLHFPNHIQKIDAAMKRWYNNKVYFFAGLEYWRYDERKGRFDYGYPKYISSGWRGRRLDGTIWRLPSRIDSAYSSPETKETFFTLRDKIFRISDRPTRLKPGYPKSIERDLLHCEVV